MYSGNFNLYFAGNGVAEAVDLKLDLSCNQLYSQLNERKSILKWVEYKRQKPECKSKLMIDSGAYSAYTLGKQIDIDDYIKFINEIGDVADVMVEVDKIPQVIGRQPTEEELEEGPKQSWANYLYMISKVDPKYRDKIMPVYHYQEDTKWLKNMLEYTHEDGTHIPYIGLAISTSDNAENRHMWLDMCFNIIKESSNPDVMTHAFGMTALSVIEDFPLTSSDSTTWVRAASFGFIILDKRTICVSNQRLHDASNILLQSPAVKEDVDRRCREYGYTLDELSESSKKRQLFNIKTMKDWENNYVRKEKKMFKAELF